MAAAEKNKPTIYVDTNVISVMFSRPSDVETLHHQGKTRDWWDNERQWFSVFGSTVLEKELRRGTYFGQHRAIATARRLPYLPVTNTVRQAVVKHWDAKVIPVSQIGDAFQLACVIIHRIDYMLTWNYAHIANPNTERKLNDLVIAENWRAPILVSPDTIPQVRLGHSIRR